MYCPPIIGTPYAIQESVLGTIDPLTGQTLSTMASFQDLSCNSNSGAIAVLDAHAGVVYVCLHTIPIVCVHVAVFILRETCVYFDLLKLGNVRDL